MTPENRLQETFDRQKKASRDDSYISLSDRLESLEKLAQLIDKNQDRICAAINEDYGNRSSTETRVLEIAGIVGSVSYLKKRLKKWMKPQKRHVGLAYFGAKNKVLPQPKGVVGIVTPWNYPLFLSLSPCLSAMAAGNRCIIKMAANSQNLCRLLDELVSAEFDSSILAVIPGTRASMFSSMPWDHLVFTGSAATGKIVLDAAAKNLTPVTLELGGKSPTIIADDFDVKEAAERILFSKFLNAGQTCVAPDYLYIPEEKLSEFVAVAKEIVSRRYADLNVKDLTSVIDQSAFSRLSGTLADAKEKGADVISLLPGDALNPEDKKIAPHIALNVSDDMLVMQDEIFGPILPIKTYQNIDEVLAYVNSRERPLALYIFSNNTEIQNKLIYNTLSGGVCINDSMLHVGQHDLPFGGIGNSGMGHYHGYEGFKEFSKMRPIFTQAKKSATLKMQPPFNEKTNKLIDFAIRFRL